MNSSTLIPDAGVMIGLDVGSVSLNTVIMDESFSVLEDYYDYVHGRPFNVLYDRLRKVLNSHPAPTIRRLAVTGAGGRLATGLIGGLCVNEIIAQATSASRLFPDVRTVIEIGGEDSKLIILDKQPDEEYPKLVDFEMNSICASPE